jgi:hypothetical protein
VPDRLFTVSHHFTSCTAVGARLRSRRVGCHVGHAEDHFEPFDPLGTDTQVITYELPLQFEDDEARGLAGVWLKCVGIVLCDRSSSASDPAATRHDTADRRRLTWRDVKSHSPHHSSQTCLHRLFLRRCLNADSHIQLSHLTSLQ